MSVARVGYDAGRITAAFGSDDLRRDLKRGAEEDAPAGGSSRSSPVPPPIEIDGNLAYALYTYIGIQLKAVEAVSERDRRALLRRLFRGWSSPEEGLEAAVRIHDALAGVVADDFARTTEYARFFDAGNAVFIRPPGRAAEAGSGKAAPYRASARKTYDLDEMRITRTNGFFRKLADAFKVRLTEPSDASLLRDDVHEFLSKALDAGSVTAADLVLLEKGLSGKLEAATRIVADGARGVLEGLEVAGNAAASGLRRAAGGARDLARDAAGGVRRLFQRGDGAQGVGRAE